MLSLVIDVGTNITKAGFASEEAPRQTFHSVIGTSRESGLRTELLNLQAHGQYVAGEEAYNAAGLLNLQHPVENGLIVNYHTYEELLLHTYYSALHTIPHDQPTLLLEAVDTSRECREKIAEILFESFTVPQAGLLNSLTSTLYSTGNCTGVCIDAGAGKTAMGAVIEGYLLQHSLRISNVAGNYLTHSLFNHLRSTGYSLSTMQDWRLVEQIKEQKCHVAMNITSELDHLHCGGFNKERNAYELPDNERIFLFDCQYTIPEMLFDVNYLSSRETDTCNLKDIVGPNHISTNHFTSQQEQFTSNKFIANTHVMQSALLRSPTGFTSSNPLCEQPLHGWAETIQEIVNSVTLGVNANNIGTTCATNTIHDNSNNKTVNLVPHASLLSSSSPSSSSSSSESSFLESSLSDALAKQLYGCVVLGGGTSLLGNVENRLQYDLTQLVSSQTGIKEANELSHESNYKNVHHTSAHNTTIINTLHSGPNNVKRQSHNTQVRCVAFPERGYAAWLGGSIWASTPTFRQSCLTKETYDECGVNCVHQYALEQSILF